MVIILDAQQAVQARGIEAMCQRQQPEEELPELNDSQLPPSADDAQETGVFMWYRLGYYDGFHSLHELDDVVDDRDKSTIVAEAGAFALKAYLRGFTAGRAAQGGAMPAALDERDDETDVSTSSGEIAIE